MKEIELSTFWDIVDFDKFQQLSHQLSKFQFLIGLALSNLFLLLFCNFSIYTFNCSTFLKRIKFFINFWWVFFRWLIFLIIIAFLIVFFLVHCFILILVIFFPIVFRTFIVKFVIFMLKFVFLIIAAKVLKLKLKAFRMRSF